MPEAWYYKVKIYNAIAANDHTEDANIRTHCIQSLDALKNYVQYDDKKRAADRRMATNPSMKFIRDCFSRVQINYNAQKYAEALTDFQGAISAIGFMYKQGWIKQTMDTTSTLYAGISAEKSEKRDAAADLL